MMASMLQPRAALPGSGNEPPAEDRGRGVLLTNPQRRVQGQRERRRLPLAGVPLEFGDQLFLKCVPLGPVG